MKGEIFIKILILIIALILLVLPQANIAVYVQPTITSKFIIFTFSCIVILCLHILSGCFSRKKTLHITKLDIILLTLLAYIILNRYVIQPYAGFSIRYLEVLGLGVMYAVLRSLPSKSYIWFLLAIVISGIIQAVYGNLQLLDYYPSNHSGFKLTGSFFNPGPYAGFLTAVWPITLAMYLFKERSIKHVQSQIQNKYSLINKIIVYMFEYIPIIGCVSIILVLPATHSRASWIAVLLSSMVLIEIRYHILKGTLKHINLIKKTTLIVISIGIIGAGLLGVYHFKKESSDGRLFIWKVTTEIIKDHPVFGVGFDRFKAHYMNYQADYFDRHGKTKELWVADNTYYAFNEGLQFIVENGLIGLLLLVFLFYYIFKVRVDKQYQYIYVCLVSCLLAIAVFSSFSYPMQILPFKIILVVLLALLADLDINKFILFKKPKQYVLVLFKIVILTMGIVGITKSIEYTIALEYSFKTWKKALNRYQYGDYEGAIQDYASAYPVLIRNGDFLMNYGKALSMNKQNKMAIQILEKAKQYLNTTIIETTLGDAYKETNQNSKAEIAYQHAADMIPSRFYPMYLLAKLYDESGDKIKAVEMAEEILKKEIKIPSTAIREIQTEMKKIVNTEK